MSLVMVAALWRNPKEPKSQFHLGVALGDPDRPGCAGKHAVQIMSVEHLTHTPASDLPVVQLAHWQWERAQAARLLFQAIPDNYRHRLCHRCAEGLIR